MAEDYIYDDYEDEGPPAPLFWRVLGKVIKYSFIALIVFINAFLLWRVLFSTNEPGAIKTVAGNSSLAAAWEQYGGDGFAKYQAEQDNIATDEDWHDQFELAEGEMGRCAMNFALGKAGLSHSDIDALIAGDLQNQCFASSVGLNSFDIPFLGIYGACSTCTEGLLIAATMMEASESYERCAVVTSSHNSAAERQFRTPLEYGGQRAGTAQWTATAAGAFILGRDGGRVKLTEFMPGKVISGETADGANMGPAMYGYARCLLYLCYGVPRVEV